MTTTVSAPVDVAAARRRTATRLAVTGSLPLAIGVVVVVGLVLWLVTNLVIGVVVGVVAGAVVGGVYLATMRAAAVPGLLRMVGADVATGTRHARYSNLVEGLCISSGITEPELFFIEDERINLMALGPPAGASLVVTTGALDSLNRVELEGLLGAGLARIRSNDAHVGAQAATFICGPLLRNGPVYPGRPMWMVTPLASWRARRLRAALGPQRDFVTDLDAVTLTRYPPGLYDAYTKAQRRGTVISECSWGAAHLWILDPLAEVGPETVEGRLNELFRNHIAIRTRMELLGEL
jgi:Zn-dependent protease with chaperone function